MINNTNVDFSLYQRIRVFYYCPCIISFTALFNKCYVGNCSQKLIHIVTLIQNENKTSNRKLSTRSASKMPNKTQKECAVDINKQEEIHEKPEDLNCTKKTTHIVHQPNKKEMSPEEQENKRIREKNKLHNDIVHAVLSNSLTLLQDLIKKNSGCDVVDCNGKKKSLVHIAVSCGHLEITKYLLSIDQLNEKNLQDKNNATPLHLAVKCNDINMIELLLNCNMGHVMLEMRDKDNNTPFHIAILEDNLELLKYLFSIPNYQYNNDITSLIDLAIKRSNVNIVKYLASLTNDNTVNDINIKWLIITAVRAKNTELVEYFLSQSSNADILNNYESEKSPLHIAVDMRNKDMVMLLLKCKARIDESKCCYKSTPLMIAVRNNDLSMIELLLSHGAKADIINENGASLLFIAVHRCHFKLVQLLIENKFCNHINTPSCAFSGLGDFSFPKAKMITPILKAVRANDLILVKYLLDNGAKIDIETEGKDILSTAIEYFNKDMFKLLIDNGAGILMIDDKGLDVASVAIKAKLEAFIARQKVAILIVNEKNLNAARATTKAKQMILVKQQTFVEWLIHDKYCNIHSTELAQYVESRCDDSLTKMYTQAVKDKQLKSQS